MVSNVPLAAVDAVATQTPVQVFVQDNHEGLRGARPDDDLGLPLYDAGGNALYFTLEKWRAGNGALDITADTDTSGDRVTLNLHRLIAFGHYSIFTRTDAADGPHFTPLDGSGLSNNFDAHVDGMASVSVSAPQHVSSGTWIVIVYHSDAQDHGNSPGDFTHTAHQQLIVKVP